MLDRVMSYRPVLPASPARSQVAMTRARARIGPTGKHQQLIRPRLSSVASPVEIQEMVIRIRLL